MLLCYWFTHHFSNACLFCVNFDRIVYECRHSYNRTEFASLEFDERLLLPHRVEPVVLRRYDVDTHLIAIHARHLDVSKHKTECPRAASLH